VQAGGVLLGAPFVVWSGLSHSLRAVIAGLVLWGLCKGVYDSNIFAAAFDVVPIRSRGTVSGLMNCIGWLLGGGAAPVAIGFLSMHISLGQAIASSAIVYVMAGIILIATAARWLPAEISRAGS
ncbi:MAG TPA: hypothetical protein VFJ10_10660, partial [Acidobacteriaceae bacterium]|nr:hypothetical protein [Acidobacteriaceae bacterium]